MATTVTFHMSPVQIIVAVMVMGGATAVFFGLSLMDSGPGWLAGLLLKGGTLCALIGVALAVLSGFVSLS